MGYSPEPEADIAQQTLMLIPLIDVGLAVRSAPRKAGEFGYSPRQLLLRDRSPAVRTGQCSTGSTAEHYQGKASAARSQTEGSQRVDSRVRTPHRPARWLASSLRP
jgi:hypothetical protein